jgi:hypothetical protein
MVHINLPLPPSKPQRFSHRWELDGHSKGRKNADLRLRIRKEAYLADATDEILRKWDEKAQAVLLIRLALSPSGDEVVIAPESIGIGIPTVSRSKMP